MTDKPKQIEPAIDPEPPTKGSERFQYYLLEKPNSPSVTPPNAVTVVQYKRRQFLHDDPNDFRRPYGYCEYERELSFTEIDKYNLLPFDPEQILLFDLWQSFDKDKRKMMEFFNRLFGETETDPDRRKPIAANKLIELGWTPAKIQKALESI